MKLQPMTLAAKAVAALICLLTLGALGASASTLDQTMFCTAAGSSSCSATAPSTGAYWTVENAITLQAGNTFNYTLTITADKGATGYLQDFSGQYFFSGSKLSNLAWVSNPGGWADLSSSKAGNGGSCQGNTPGAFCGSVDLGGAPIALSSTPTVIGISGAYTGTFLQNGTTYNFQLAAANNSNGSGGNAFAISMPLSGTAAVPDGGMTVMLLGGALVGLGTLRRKFRA